MTPLVGDVPTAAHSMAPQEVLRHVDHVDVLVNNAGSGSHSAAMGDKAFLDDVRSRLVTAVMGTVTATETFAPPLVAGACVLNMGSVYATTAEAGMRRTLPRKARSRRSLALRPPNLVLAPSVPCVSPGWVDVPKWADYVEEGTLRHLREDFMRVPMRSAITVDEIAAVFALLAHEDAAAIPRQDIVVDKGMSSDLYVAVTLP